MKGISMKTMKYIWIVLGLLSVVAVEAATYGKSYQPQHRTAYFHAQTRLDMPVARMSSVNSTTMYSGSSLPLAAATGVSTAGNSPSAGFGGPRRARMEDDADPVDPFGGQTINETQDPLQPGSPLGDALLPMMLMAILFAAFITLRRRKKVKWLNR